MLTEEGTVALAFIAVVLPLVLRFAGSDGVATWSLR